MNNTDDNEFYKDLQNAFGANVEQPIVFWYSDEPCWVTDKQPGCFFKHLDFVRRGGGISLNATNIVCGGGKFFTGFAPMPDFVPELVSHRENINRTLAWCGIMSEGWMCG